MRLSVLAPMLATAQLPVLPQDKIFCDGRLLELVQMSQVFNDSKHFVDMQLLADPEVVVAAFSKQFPAAGPAPPKQQVAAFVSSHFADVGGDIMNFVPLDWTATPQLLSRLPDPENVIFARFLNEQWKSLGRKHTPDVFEHPQRYSALALPHEFIVAGGRFREMYYWCVSC